MRLPCPLLQAHLLVSLAKPAEFLTILYYLPMSLIPHSHADRTTGRQPRQSGVADDCAQPRRPHRHGLCLSARRPGRKLQPASPAHRLHTRWRLAVLAQLPAVASPDVLPIIMLTVSSQAEIAQAQRAFPHLPFLQRPFHLKALAALMADFPQGSRNGKPGSVSVAHTATVAGGGRHGPVGTVEET